MKVDVAIIGGGPAGFEAAVTLKIRNKSFALFSEAPSLKLVKAHSIANYLGFPEISGQDLSDKFLEHLKQLEIEPVKDSINLIYNTGDGFSLQGRSSEFYEASAIILCTGVSNNKMFPNEEKLLGNGISYCATCDGMLYRKQDVCVLSYNQDEDKADIDFLKEICSKVDVVDGNDVKDISFDTNENGDILMTYGGETKNYRCVFIMRDQVPPNQLMSELEIVDKHIKVDLNMHTNIPGVFAAGDVVGKPYQYIKAAGQGNTAALSCVEYLSKIGKNAE